MNNKIIQLQFEMMSLLWLPALTNLQPRCETPREPKTARSLQWRYHWTPCASSIVQLLLFGETGRWFITGAFKSYIMEKVGTVGTQALTCVSSHGFSTQSKWLSCKPWSRVCSRTEHRIRKQDWERNKNSIKRMGIDTVVGQFRCEHNRTNI